MKTPVCCVHEKCANGNQIKSLISISRSKCLEFSAFVDFVHSLFLWLSSQFSLLFVRFFSFFPFFFPFFLSFVRSDTSTSSYIFFYSFVLLLKFQHCCFFIISLLWRCYIMLTRQPYTSDTRYQIANGKCQISHNAKYGINEGTHTTCNSSSHNEHECT